MSYLVSNQYGSTAQALKPSIYEHLTPAGLIAEQKTHFVEWFSGDALDSIWTYRDVSGTGSGAMNDAVDGGYSITSGASNPNSSMIDFNDINHYSNTGSVVIGVSKNNTATDYFHIVGFTEQVGSPADTRISYNQDSTASFQILYTSVNGSSTTTNTTLSLDQVFNKSKIELRASTAVLWVNDTLECISTSTLPDVALQPHFRQGTRTSAARTGSIRYMECYNT